MQMNGVRQGTSACIQSRLLNVVSMINETGDRPGDLEIPFEQETTMLKTISAALLAVSVLAAPALAAGSSKTSTDAPVIKTTQGKATQAKTIQPTSTQSTTTKATTTQAKSGALNANARMGKHHHKHVSHRRHHNHNMAARTTHAKIQAKTVLKTGAKLSLKPASSTTKRG